MLLICRYEQKTPAVPLPIMTVSLTAASSAKTGSQAKAGNYDSQKALHKAEKQTETKKRSVKNKSHAVKKNDTELKKTVIQPHKDKSSSEKTAAKEAAPFPAEGSDKAADNNAIASGATAGTEGGNGSGRAAGEGNGGSGAGTADQEEITDSSRLTVLKKVLPDYPLFSRKRKEEGTSVVIAETENGIVLTTELEKTSGFERLDTAALKAAKGWKFRTEARLRVRIPFTFIITQ